MNIKTKKIIAREFLVFLICIGISIVTFLAIYPYNYFMRNKIDSFKKDISEKKILSDSLSKSYMLKYDTQFWFTGEFNKKFNMSNTKLWESLYEIAKGDSVKYKWENTWDNELILFNNNTSLIF